MGYIKEPDGVDFIIKSIPLSEKEEKELELENETFLLIVVNILTFLSYPFFVSYFHSFYNLMGD